MIIAALCAAFALWLLEVVDGVAPPCAVHELVRSVVGDVPAEAFAPRHVDPEGPPLAPLPSEPFAEKLSDAVDGPVPQLVSRLTSVGTPGEASTVEQVDAFLREELDPALEGVAAAEPAPLNV